jgi:hypothetical protein
MNYIVYEETDTGRLKFRQTFPTQDRAENVARELNRKARESGDKSRFIVRPGVN